MCIFSLMIMSTYLTWPREPVMCVFFMVELCQSRELSFCGFELFYLLGGMALCVMLYLLIYSSVINESCHNT